jgi:hypothetical protein
MSDAPQSIQINSPPGYGRLVPLNRAEHASLGIANPGHCQWCRELNSAYVCLPELPRAALDYPIGFARDGASGDYFPIAVFGLRNGQNLFVNEHGRWLAHTYMPAYVRRHPFCIVEMPAAAAGAAEVQRLICVEEGGLAPSPTPLFNAGGEPTAAWTPVLQLIESLEAAREPTREFTRRLAALGLFTPFEALGLPNAQAPLRLEGLFRIDEQKLSALDAATLQPLLRTNQLRAVYAHLLSLENFAKLLAMTVEADGRRAQTH